MKILLADDHALIRSGLRNELAALAPVVDFVEAWDAVSLRTALESHRDLDLALVDLTMPGMQGAASIAAIRNDFPTIPLIVVSGVDTGPHVQAILRTGAAGYIPKSALPQVMLQAIRLVLAGGQYVPPELMRLLDDDAASNRRSAAPAATLSSADASRLKLLATRHQRRHGQEPRRHDLRRARRAQSRVGRGRGAQSCEQGRIGKGATRAADGANGATDFAGIAALVRAAVLQRGSVRSIATRGRWALRKASPSALGL